MQITSDQVFAHLDGFINFLRTEGFSIPLSAKLDAFAAITHIDLTEQQAFAIALRANLCRNQSEQKLFDLCFNAYWLDEELEREVSDDSATHPGDEDAEGQYQEASEKGLMASAHAEKGGETLDEGWLDFERDLDKAMLRLRKLMRKNKSRRSQLSRNGERLNLKNTLQNYQRQGFEFVELSRQSRRLQKLKLISLIDLSHSMTKHVEYLMRFVMTMHRQLPLARTVFFSSEAKDMTRIIQKSSNQEVLDAMQQHFSYWSSGTDIGGALELVNKDLPSAELNKATLLMISDGFDQGQPETLAHAMDKISKRVKSIIWINPLKHTTDYAPEARAMKFCLPYIDHFLAAHDGKSLLNAVNKIATA